MAHPRGDFGHVQRLRRVREEAEEEVLREGNLPARKLLRDGEREAALQHGEDVGELFSIGPELGLRVLHLGKINGIKRRFRAASVNGQN
jgi:hypothetical protein